MVMSITIALTMTSQSEQSPQQHALAVGIAAQGEEARLRTAQRFKCWLTGGLVNQISRLLPVRNAAALAEHVQLLDVHRKNGLNNLQFYCFLPYATNLKKDQIMPLFDLLDRNNPLEKQFIPRHARPAFQLLDGDGDNLVDFNEFEATRFLFNIQKEELKIFKVFDISRDEERAFAGGLSPLQNYPLNYREFTMFAVFRTDKQQQKEERDQKQKGTRERAGAEFLELKTN
ncbi:EF-hand calcium-binding domain-containing protein 9 [Rissa tridactyla]|uniref:EF-hand calcium-binding domain-containing protein 9 n=1 Tax=Rissa tridactyla TaxID=75485 RepID=UPI0023BA3DC8|nr:EF-hand calcium-binding domain-containing protein 9 [Rissa tridactyla]